MVSFTATVHFRGPNPCVDVPVRVSEELQPFAASGRIRVTGRLDGVEFNATLMPVKPSGHVLYVPGGLRAASGVKVGDTATLDILPLAPHQARPPEDLASALNDAAGARQAWDRLPAAHRRELIRFLEDARTPGTRAHRIEQTVAQSLGRDVPPPSPRAKRALWTCPSCGRKFVTPNMYHSCQQHSLDDPFRSKPDHVRQLFDLVRHAIESIGPVILVPHQDRVAFMVRVRFAGAVPRKRWLDVEFWLTRRVESERFHRIETLTPRTHIHTVRLLDPSDVDGELEGWLREAYAVGRQDVTSPVSSPNHQSNGVIPEAPVTRRPVRE
ncbi:YdeI/OmpD-associated family protein [Arthrobacter sp. CJ23]|uniref:YdeI/OmpD-associated family protein n=1 Tax=Arthrobacter sp. CJ23 TaxID=2972479 RepID=UPI00215B798C|nr:YdeI/OmpD-associated family protein [Arthrobacter sp. CJ23]UVJ39182.1 YdeI/OmpD-associated family protein [Arthrobacter sp. CJ23]